MHNSVIEILKKEGLFKVYKRSLQAPKDQDIYKDKDKDKEKERKFEEIWKRYPNTIGKKAAKGHFVVSVKTEDDWLNINRALNNYLASERVKDGYIQNGSTWFNNWQDWVDFKEIPKQKIVDEFKKEKELQDPYYRPKEPDITEEERQENIKKTKELLNVLGKTKGMPSQLPLPKGRGLKKPLVD